MTDIDEIEAAVVDKTAEYTDVDARLAFLALAALAHRVLAEYPDARYVDATYTDEPGTPSLVFERVSDGTSRVDNRREQFTVDLDACRDAAWTAAHRGETYTS